MRSPRVSFIGRSLALVMALAGVAAPGLALAQPATGGAPTAAAKADAMVDYKIPAQPLVAALRQFAEVTGLQLVYDAKITAGKQSSAVAGAMSANAALTRLLAGSGLSFTFSANGPVLLSMAGSSGARALGVVRVEGSSADGKATVVNGVNGSRDMQATEGTGSYTTNGASLATKSIESLKDTPFAVSVVTRQRLDDQAINSLYSVMDQMTGVTSSYGGTNQTREFLSRGFFINSYTIDGGSPLTTTFGNLPLIDLSIYDSVQIQRGAAGLFNGYGDPGGIINLQRKKPLDHNQFTAEAQVGSWQTYRSSLDATGPIGFDGKLRGRVVVTDQSNHYFYDVAKDRVSVFYANLEADLTPTTRLSGGLNETRNKSVPFSSGLPRYLNGDDLHLPTSTCLCYPWGRSDVNTTEFFAQLDQKLGDDWTFDSHLTRSRTTSDAKYGLIDRAVNNVTLDGPTAKYLELHRTVTQTVLDANVKGAFEVLGMRQQVVFGANLQRVNATPQTIVGLRDVGDGTANPLTFDPNSVANSVEPASRPPSTIYNASGQRQWGAYVNLNLSPFDRLHVLTGVRYTEYTSDTSVTRVCNDLNDFGCAEIGKPSTIFALFGISPTLVNRDSGRNLSKPNLSVSYDLSKDMSLFGTYASIYTPQGSLVTKEGKPLAPVTGRNVELGVKWATPEKDLNASFSAYSIVQNNIGVLDPDPDAVALYTSSGGTSCCYLDTSKGTSPIRRESTGFDAELTGRLLKKWQMSFGYTYALSKYVNPTDTRSGTPLQSQQPKHTVKLFTTYRFNEDEWLSRLTVGGGVNWQSAAYKSGTSCAQLNTTTGDCLPNQSVPFDYTIKSYALVQGYLAYQIDNTWQVSLNGTNLTNHKGYQTIDGSPSGGNWYLQPATYTLTLRGKW